jgi:hypothetical protein
MKNKGFENINYYRPIIFCRGFDEKESNSKNSIVNS